MAGSSTFPVIGYEFPRYELPADFQFADGKAGDLQRELADELRALNVAASAHRSAVRKQDAKPDSSPFAKAVRETADTLRLVRDGVVGLMKDVYLAGAPIIPADPTVDVYTADVLKLRFCRFAALEAARAFDVILKEAGDAVDLARFFQAGVTKAADEAKKQVSNADAIVAEKAEAVQAAESNLDKAIREKEEADKAKSIATSAAKSALQKTEDAKEAVYIAEANLAYAEEKAGKKRQDPGQLKRRREEK